MSFALPRRASVVAFAALGASLSAGPERVSAASTTTISARVQTAVVQSQATPRVVSRGWLGANFRVYEDESANEIILVTETLPDSPAFLNGIRPGDRVIRVNGTPATGDLFSSVASRLGAGDPIAFTLRRGETTIDIAMRAGERPDEATLLPRLVQIQLDSSQAVFEHRLRSIEQARGQEGVFFSAPHVRVVNSDGEMQIVAEFQSSAQPGQLLVRGGDGQSMSFEMRFPDPEEALPLLMWIQADSLAGGVVGERQAMDRRLMELVTQVKNLQGGTGRATTARNQRLVEMERALRESESRIASVRTNSGNSLRLIEPLDDDVLITSQEGVTLLRRSQPRGGCRAARVEPRAGRVL